MTELYARNGYKKELSQREENARIVLLIVLAIISSTYALSR